MKSVRPNSESGEYMVRAANSELRQARLRTPSPQTPGESLSRAELAELINVWVYEQSGRIGAVTAGYVGKLERGLIRWPQRDYRDAMRAVLHVATDRELGFRRPVPAGPAAWELLSGPAASGSAPPATVPPATVPPASRRPDHGRLPGAPASRTDGPSPYRDSGPVGGPGTDMAISSETALVLGVPVPPSWFEIAERANAALRADHVDARMVEALEQSGLALAGMYRSADPRATLPMATALADQMLGLLDASARDGNRARLVAATAGTHAQVGLWACHSDRPALAYRHLATACQVADGAGDPGLRARALGAFGYLLSSAPRGGHGGDPARALRLLDEALDLVGSGDAFTLGWLATWRADQYATLGDLPAACADTATAATALDTADPGPDGFFSRATYGYGMEAHLDSVRGVVEALAGGADTARDTFAQVCRTAANMRRVIATHGHMALAHARLQNPEEACDALARSVTMAVQEHYPMGLQRAIGVRRRFDPSWPGLPCVRDLDEQIGELLRAERHDRG